MIDFKVSIIIPVYNGALTISNLIDALKIELEEKVTALEIVLINDGSIDNSTEICKKISKNNKNILFLNLSKNFGEHQAVMAGLNNCNGDVAVIIDDDFQNPPSEVIFLLKEIATGKDVVYSFFRNKKHHFLRNVGSLFTNYIASKVLDKPKELYLSSFKAMNRFVINECIKYKGPYPYIDGLIFRVTKNVSSVEVLHIEREKGKSGYTLKKLISVWLNMFLNFSTIPLRFIIYLGFLLSSISAIFLFWFVIEKILNPAIQTGWTSLIAVILLFSGIQFIFLGVIGEYLGRLFMRNNGKPQFVIKEKI